MKKFYRKAEIEIVEFNVEDVISTSDPNMGDSNDWGNGHDVGDEE